MHAIMELNGPFSAMRNLLFTFMILSVFGMNAQSDTDTTLATHITKGPEYALGDEYLAMELKRGIVHFGTTSLVVDFIVNTDGTPSNFTIGGACLKEAEEKLRSNFAKVKKFNPAKDGQRTVRYHMTLLLVGLPK